MWLLPFNRTIVELKYQKTNDNLKIIGETFNRTIVELKYCN